MGLASPAPPGIHGEPMPRHPDHAQQLAIPSMRHLHPVRLTVSEMAAMPDAELADLLASGGNADGTIYPAMAHAISAELLRRQIERSMRPHWAQTPTFWVSVASLVLSAVLGVAQLWQPAAPVPPAEPASQPQTDASKSRSSASGPQP